MNAPLRICRNIWILGNEQTDTTITISIHVEGVYDEYKGNYSVTIPLVVDEDEDNAFWSFNDEPIFINGNGNKCIWKQDSNQWLIGNCDELGVNKGFAHMKDCKCPWPR